LDQRTYDKGLEIRSAVLGEAYVSKALTEAVDSFRIAKEAFTELDQS